MALKAPDMSQCSPKKKCCCGGNKGVVYDPLDPCPSGSRFDSAICDCIVLSTVYLVGFTVQLHDDEPCGGILTDPCDAGGPCPTTVVTNPGGEVKIGQTGLGFTIDSFVEFQNYGPGPNIWCSSNVGPAGLTYAQAFGVDYATIGVIGVPAADNLVGGYGNSLWAIATDENNDTWAIRVHWTSIGDGVASTYRTGGYTNITYAPQTS